MNIKQDQSPIQSTEKPMESIRRDVNDRGDGKEMVGGRTKWKREKFATEREG